MRSLLTVEVRSMDYVICMMASSDNRGCYECLLKSMNYEEFY